MTEPHVKRVHPNVTLAVLSLAGVAYAALSSTVIPALPSIQHSLHASENGVTWLLTGYLLSASVGTSILGRLGDMYGKERVLLWTLVVLAGGTLLGALATSLPVMITARVIQGAGGGIFPLAFGIVRDEFPREKVAGSIGILSSILGVGAGIGIVLAGVIIQHLSYHWLYWLPLMVIVVSAACTWWFVPESPVRVPGRVNWLAAALMSVGISVILIAVSETISWGWGWAKTIGLIAVGALICAAWVMVEIRSREPLIDMTMMRIRGVWTTNVAAFLLGAGMYASFIVFPQFAQLPKSTGFGFGASTLVSGFYLLPATLGMMLLGTAAGTISAAMGLEGGAPGRHRVHRRLVPSARARPRSPIRPAHRRGAARDRDGTRLCRARKSHRPGSAGASDGRGERNEHRDAHARRRPRRPALGDLHRPQCR